MERERDHHSLPDIIRNQEELARDVAIVEVEVLCADPLERGDAFLTISRVGRGEAAAAWAAALRDCYLGWARRRGLEWTLLDERADADGLAEATLHLRGAHAYGFLRAESGLHRRVESGADGRHVTCYARVRALPAGLEPPAHAQLEEDGDAVEAALPGGPRVRVGGPIAADVRRSLALALLAGLTVAGPPDETVVRVYQIGRHAGVRDPRTGERVGNLRRVLAGEIEPFMMAALRPHPITAASKERGEAAGDGAGGEAGKRSEAARVRREAARRQERESEQEDEERLLAPAELVEALEEPNGAATLQAQLLGGQRARAWEAILRWEPEDRPSWQADFRHRIAAALAELPVELWSPVLLEVLDGLAAVATPAWAEPLGWLLARSPLSDDALLAWLGPPGPEGQASPAPGRLLSTIVACGLRRLAAAVPRLVALSEEGATALPAYVALRLIGDPTAVPPLVARLGSFGSTAAERPHIDGIVEVLLAAPTREGACALLRHVFFGEPYDEDVDPIVHAEVAARLAGAVDLAPCLADEEMAVAGGAANLLHALGQGAREGDIGALERLATLTPAAIAALATRPTAALAGAVAFAVRTPAPASASPAAAAAGARLAEQIPAARATLASPTVRAVCIAALEGEHHLLWQPAIAALGEAGPEALAPLLAFASRQRHAWQAANAVHAAARNGPMAAAPLRAALAGWLDAPDPDEQATLAALSALAELGDPEGAPLARRALDHPESAVREAALALAGVLAEPSQALRQRVEALAAIDPVYGVRQTATRLLIAWRLRH